MHSPAPQPTYRLIPSRFPPIGLFDTVALAADLEAVMDLAGWTNDRLVKERVARLPQSEWAYGRPNSSIVMAAFLHAAPERRPLQRPRSGRLVRRGRDPHGRRRGRSTTCAARPWRVALQGMQRTFRSYSARLDGAFVDIRGTEPALHATDDYTAGQAFGEAQRAAGEDGILYDSVRHHGGTNACAYRPSKVLGRGTGRALRDHGIR